MSQDFKTIKLLIEKYHAELSNFITSPHDYLAGIQTTCDTLFNETDRLNLPIFKSTLVELFQDLLDLGEALSRFNYTDPDLLEEAQLFISGALQDIRAYLSNLEKEADSKDLKEKNVQKLYLLKDWVHELTTSLPVESLDQSQDLPLTKYIIFKMSGECFAIAETQIKEIIHVKTEKFKPIDEPNFSYVVTHRKQKIFIFDREAIFGEKYSTKKDDTKIILVREKENTQVGLEVDKIIKIQELDASSFTAIKEITGPQYGEIIAFITLIEGIPLFIFGKYTNKYFKEIILTTY